MATTGPISLDQLVSPYIKNLVYGGPGVGKTVFCASSQHYRTFYFDVDDGMLSARRFATRPDLIHTWPTRSYADFVAGFQYLTTNVGNYQLAVVDTATELQRQMLNELMVRNKRVLPEQRDWGALLLMMEEVARWFRHLPLHVFWTAHEVEKEDEDTKRTMFRPSFQGQFGREYSKHFSGIFRYQVMDQQVREGDAVKFVSYRMLNCHRDYVVHAKDRSHSLAKFEEPHLDSIIYKMTSSPNLQGGTDA